jgi:hypothetical protein
MKERSMAELTQLETKLAEVMGLAQAAKDSTEKVKKLVDDEEVRRTRRSAASSWPASSRARRPP